VIVAEPAFSITSIGVGFSIFLQELANKTTRVNANNEVIVLI
jgi:hypothetical protein